MGSSMLSFSDRMASWLYKAESLPKLDCKQERGHCSARWPLNHAGGCHPSCGVTCCPANLSEASPGGIVPQARCEEVFCCRNRAVLFSVDPTRYASCHATAQLHMVEMQFPWSNNSWALFWVKSIVLCIYTAPSLPLGHDKTSARQHTRAVTIPSQEIDTITDTLLPNI